MVCLYCNRKLSVTNSRPQLSRNQTWRRRLCKPCGAVFTTTEAIDLTQSIIVSSPADNSDSDGARNEALTAFDRDKLFISIYKSLQHRRHAARDARGICDTVVAAVASAASGGTIEARTLTTITLNTLQRFDSAAATHYAAFHTQP